MKKSISLIVLALAAISWQNVGLENWKDKVAPALLEKANRNGSVSFIVLLEEQADLSQTPRAASKEEKGQYVFQKLQETAARSQQAAIRILKEHQAPYQAFYIINALHSRGDLTLIQRLAALEEVKAIQDNPEVLIEKPVKTEAAEISNRSVEWGISKIGADQVWEMGFRGQGVVVGGQDTGFEWEHPAIQNKYRGWDGEQADHNYNWHDAIHEINPLNNDANNPCGLNSPIPCDDHNHGTHTMGTMVGDDGMGNQIGVAPDARWVACRNMERGWGSPASYIECFEWFLAPTDLNGENPDPTQAPHVINNSWSCPEIEGCNPDNFELMQLAVDHLKTAGVVVVVSAGNNGSECSTVNTPSAIFENSFSVGATNITDAIAGFSSRGPVLVDGSGRLKPNVSAPGVDVRSCIRGGGYASFSGTSMAGPHTVGLVALLISANPELAGQVETIESIIEQTAASMTTDQDCADFLGAQVPNAVFGYGRIDAVAAVEAALALISDTDDAQAATVSLEMLPNPAQSYLRIAVKGLDAPRLLSFYNAAGQMVESRLIASDGNMEWNISRWPAGIYFYQMPTAQGLLSGRLVKGE
ncbi:MAG TPA: S8 family serine peptidase [Saprospiraceae bacterium]|nr:S8 family serine peptidase [Saprospiraceae bacterium]HMQ84414.1 S8 family serine peptidase [Saprospiraceae bacterium]